MKKILVASLALCTLVLSLTACGAKGEEDKFAEGKYEGEALGYGGKLVVEVEVDESTIKNVTIKESLETQGIGSNAVESLPAQIVEKQGTDAVEKVAGATKSSDAIISAVNSALEKAARVDNE